MNRSSLYRMALGVLGLSVFGTAATHATLAVNIANYGAVGDGSTNNYAAFQKALGDIDAAGGGSLEVPKGNFLIKATLNGYTNGQPNYKPLMVGSNTTIWGDNEYSSVISVGTDSTNSQSDYFRHFITLGTMLTTGHNVTVEYLTIKKVAASFLTFFEVNSANFKLYSVLIDGANNQYPQTSTNFSVGILIADWGPSYPVTNLTVDTSVIQHTDYGLVEYNCPTLPNCPTTATVNGIHVTNSNLLDPGPSGDGLVFNSPSGLMENITVDHTYFRGFHSLTGGSGGVVSFANVQGGSVTNSTFDDSYNDCVHVEDRSSNITISGNKFSRCGEKFYGPIIVLGGIAYPSGAQTNLITIQNNIIDSSCNTTKPGSGYLVLVTGNGRQGYETPAYVTVTGNTFYESPFSSDWYVDPAVQPFTQSGNSDIPYNSCT
jgi:hypothetical protein